MFHVKHLDPHRPTELDPDSPDTAAAIFGSRIGQARRYAEILAAAGWNADFSGPAKSTGCGSGICSTAR